MVCFISLLIKRALLFIRLCDFYPPYQTPSEFFHNTIGPLLFFTQSEMLMLPIYMYVPFTLSRGDEQITKV